MAKVKKTKKPKSAVVPMSFNGDAVTPIGVDASWTGLAVTALEWKSVELPHALIDGVMVPSTVKRGTLQVRMSEVLSTKPEDYPCQAARLLELGRQFLHHVRNAVPIRSTPCLVAIEGYAMGSKTRPQMAGELGGHLRLLLWQAGIPYIIVPPNSLKTYVLDKGNAPKELMMMKTLKRWGYESPCNDTCDAYCLARVAAEFAAGGWTKKFEKLAQGFECVGVKS